MFGFAYNLAGRIGQTPRPTTILVIEDGSAVTYANSYVTLAQAVAYAKQRGKDSLFDDANAEAWLVEATDYLESQEYIGRPAWLDQALSWPRDGVYLNGVYNPYTTIPDRLKKAQIEAALVIASGVDINPVLSGKQVIQKTVDVLTTKYSERNNYITPLMPKVNALLAPLLANIGGLHTYRV